MDQILGLVGLMFDLALVILGFGFIVFVHELGHFLAARWAGIRVLAFALGFGSAAFSYRKGMGWRRGSSEREYVGRMKAAADGGTPASVAGISPTEYRFNWLPFGGYVKMLGQDDMNPGAISTAPDSYQNCKPWKRMVVISAGVVMNLILAASLFVGVFMYGLKTEPAKIGVIVPGSPASRATLVSGSGGVGLAPGDVVTAINGRKPNSFNDLILATAMTERSGVLRLNLSRPGVAGEIVSDVVPEAGPITGLPEIGVEPARSNRILSTRNAAEFELGKTALAKRGLPGVEPGMALIELDGKPVKSAAEADAIVRMSNGRTLEAVFTNDSGKRVTVAIVPEAELQVGRVAIGDKTFAVVQHLLGLSPVLKVAPASDPSLGKRQGLEDEDIFARLGAAEFPGSAEGIAEIRSHKGKKIPVSVLRKAGDGGRTLVRLDPPPTVSREGLIGFGADL
jgi:regulator of sigma E protease